MQNEIIQLKNGIDPMINSIFVYSLSETYVSLFNLLKFLENSVKELYTFN